MALLDFLNPLNAITDGIVKWQLAKEQAKTDEGRIRAEVEIKTLETRRDLQVAAAQYDKWWSPRTLIGWIIVIFLGRVFIWDNVLGLGTTGYPGSLVLDTTGIVVAFFFASETIIKATDRVATAIRRR
jgi:hypothetical protein